MKQWIPFFSWISAYTKYKFKADLVGGITVGIVLIPQGIAYALIAGLPPIYGLYSALLPQIMYVLFGTSQRAAVGPVAMDSLIVATGISVLAVGGTDAYIALAVLLAFMVGLIQLTLGLGKLGFIVNFLSRPVISGFSSAAAIIIGVNQLKNFTGIDIPRSNQLQQIVIGFFQKLNQLSWQTLVVGLITVLILYTIKWTKSKIPGPLLVVVLGTLALAFYHQQLQEVAVLKDIPSGLPTFKIPNITYASVISLIPVALTLAIIGFLETISIGKAIELPDDDVKINPNKELVALGLMNITGSFFRSYPTTASFSRSAVNDEAGSKTALAGVFSVLVVVLVLIFLTPYFYYLPKAVLAAIIMVSVVKLVNYKEAQRLWRLNQTDFWMLLITFLGTLFWGIKEGIMIGVVLSLFMLIVRTSKPHFAVLGRIPNTNVFRNISRFEEVEVDDDVLIFRFDARLYFANSNYFVDSLKAEVYKKEKSLQLIIIDCECINGMDSTALQAVEEQIHYYESQNISMFFTNIKGPVRDVLSKGGVVSQLGQYHFFINNHNAIQYHKTGVIENRDQLSGYIYQSNI